MTQYIIAIRSNPGIYGEDEQGIPWTTFGRYNSTEPCATCAECGKGIFQGYMRGGYPYQNGKRGEWIEYEYFCTSHIYTQYHAQSDIVASLQYRIAQQGGEA